MADGAFDFLGAGEMLTLTYIATVNDGHAGIVTKPFTVTVTGTNDTPVITSAPQIGTITERAGTVIRRHRMRPTARSHSPMSI